MAKKTKGPSQKQRANVYTMMLIVSLLALTGGATLLYLDLERYRPDPNTPIDVEAKDYRQQKKPPPSSAAHDMTAQTLTT